MSKAKGDLATSSGDQLADSTKLILERAADEARKCNHKMISTVHLLRALVNYRGHTMRRILHALGIKPDQIFSRINIPGCLPPGLILYHRYRVLGTLGVGGIGAVYLMRDLYQPDVKRMVALKEMINVGRNEQLTEQEASNFTFEMSILSTNFAGAIPKIFDIFATEDRLYVVHEYIEGRDLESVLSSTDEFLPVDQVLKWSREICEILSALHHRAVVFGAVMPSNIMITEKNHVRLLLGGLVHFAKQGMQIMCREGYAPPEQRAGPVLPGSDVCALGATMHHLLTRQDPRLAPEFTFDERPIQAYNPNVPDNLVEVIMRALDPDPKSRFASAREMGQALAEIEDDGSESLGIPI